MVNAAPGDWSRDFAIDTTQKNSGNSSLRVKSASSETGTSGSAYKMLAVPATAGRVLGALLDAQRHADRADDHNVFAGGSTGSDAERRHRRVRRRRRHRVQHQRRRALADRLRAHQRQHDAVLLPANTWHCVEMSFNGTGRVQQLFVNGNAADQRHQLPVGRPWRSRSSSSASSRSTARAAPDLVRRRRGRADAHRRLQLERCQPRTGRSARLRRGRRRRGGRRARRWCTSRPAGRGAAPPPRRASCRSGAASRRPSSASGSSARAARSSLIASSASATWPARAFISAPIGSFFAWASAQNGSSRVTKSSSM